MISTADNNPDSILPSPPTVSTNKKRSISNSLSQTTLNSFVIKSISHTTTTDTPHSTPTNNLHESQPKKPRHNTLLQPTLFDILHIDSQYNSSRTQNSPKLKIDCLTSSNALTRFKRRRLTSPMSPSQKRKDSLIKHNILEKRRKLAVTNQAPDTLYRT